jgi:methionyl-tRNA synthetase
VVNRYHSEFLQCWERMGISFDLYTTTGTANHREVVQDIFLTLLKKDYIYKGAMLLPFCPSCRRFLPDRYVEGTCPHCGNPAARGDQCDRCGKPLNPEDLRDAHCRICGATPQIRESEHFFLRLSAFQEALLKWVRQQPHWKPNVLNFTLRYLEEGLKDRAITRDISWGIPVPLKGYDDKRIYVWFEAVIGYLSAAKEWAQRQGDPEGWREFWEEPSTRSYYFIGKDNIPFHTIIWPAMLMGYGGLNLPYDVPANEFLTLEGRQFSTSRNWAVWLPDYLERYDPDPLRYYLSVNMPEAGDADFSWADFLRRNNDELVATYGNLVHRVLTFTYRHFQGRIPAPGEMDELDNGLLEKARATLGEVDTHLSTCRFREAVRSFMSLAQEANRYIDAKAPWRRLESDPKGCATTLWVCITAISCLKTVTYPFMPFSAQALHHLLGFQGRVEEAGWVIQQATPGQPIPQPRPLFSKLEEKVVETELQRLGSRAG